MRILRFMAPAYVVLAATPVLADQVFNEGLTVIAPQICVGSSCFEDVPGIPTGEGLRVRAPSPRILLEDSSNTLGEATDDWQISANDGFGVNSNEFAIENLGTGSVPFVIKGGNGTGAHYMDDDGNLGLGTTIPEADIHIISPNFAQVILEVNEVGSSKFGFVASSAGVGFADYVSQTVPFAAAAGAPDFAMFINNAGFVGLGTDSPSAPLELSSGGSFNFFRISAKGAEVNDSVDITFTGGPLGTGQLRYNIVDGDNQEMSLDADGNMVLDGTLTTAGPTCAGGCDRVFDADYPLPEIAERAELMFAAGHLPAIGPTAPNAPVNVSETLGNVINELEHAHIYIAQQNERLDQQAQHLSEQSVQLAQQARLIAALTARLDASEPADQK